MNTENHLSKSIIWVAFITGATLLIPLIAMQYSEEVVWTLMDFIIAGILIFGTGAVFKRLIRKPENLKYRVAVGIACATGLLLIWANLAVGIIGTENNPINLLYFGVIIIGLIFAFISRFRAKGMSFALFGTALAQALIAAIALIGGYYQSPPGSIIEILIVNAFFIALWLGSGFMFRYASENNSDSEPDFKPGA